MRIQVKRRKTAAMSAILLVTSSFLAFTGLQGSAQAAVPSTLTCNTGSNAPLFQTSYNSTNTFTLSPASVSVGTPVTVSYSATAGLDNASPATLNAGTAQPLIFVKITWSDASTSQVVAATPPGSFPATNIPSTFPYTNTGPFTATTTVTAVGDGVANAIIEQLVVNGGLATYCSTTAGNFPLATDPEIQDAGYTAAAGINGPFPATQGSQINGAYQAFRASGGPVIIRLSGTATDFGSASTTVTGPIPSITMTKSAVTTSFAQVGDDIDYEFDVSNNGAVDLTKVAIDDPLIGSVDCSAVAATLAPGDSGTCTGTYTVDAGDIAAGKVENTATATADGAGDPVESDPSTATVDIATPELTLTKTADPIAFSFPGDTIDYSFKVENTGDLTLTDIAIDDALTSGATCPAAADSLAAGATVACTASYETTAGDITAAGFTNTATATGKLGNTTVTSNESSVDVEYVAPIPDLSLEKTADVNSFSAAGETIAYSFAVSNSGEVPLTDVSVTDPLIPDVDCSAVPATLEPGDDAVCVGEYVATADDVTAGEITNEATASADTGGVIVGGARVGVLDVIDSPVSSVTIPFVEGGPQARPKASETFPELFCDTTSRIVAGSPGGVVPIEDWTVELEVTPAAAPPGDVVQISVTSDSSPINVGPTTLAVGSTRFDATVELGGDTIQLRGPTNAAPVGPFDGVIFPANELPTTATGTATAPDAEGLAEITLLNLWYNNLGADSGNGDALTGIFDFVCNRDSDPASQGVDPIGLQVSFLVDADAPPTGITPDPEQTTPPTTDETTDPTSDTSGSTLPATGGSFTPNLLAALVLFQLGLILAVRSVRATPRQRGAHA